MLVQQQAWGSSERTRVEDTNASWRPSRTPLKLPGLGLSSDPVTVVWAHDEPQYPETGRAPDRLSETADGPVSVMTAEWRYCWCDRIGAVRRRSGGCRCRVWT